MSSFGHWNNSYSMIPLHKDDDDISVINNWTIIRYSIIDHKIPTETPQHDLLWPY